jgi:hypothetical protein
LSLLSSSALVPCADHTERTREARVGLRFETIRREFYESCATTPEHDVTHDLLAAPCSVAAFTAVERPR